MSTAHWETPTLTLARVNKVNYDRNSLDVSYLSPGAGGLVDVPMLVQQAGPEGEGEIWLPAKDSIVVLALIDSMPRPVALGCVTWSTHAPADRDPLIKIWRHVSGSLEKIFANGARWLKVVADQVVDVAQAYFLKVGTDYSVIVSGEADTRVGGAATTVVEGMERRHVLQESKHTYGGDHISDYQGSYGVDVTQNMLTRAQGDIVTRANGNAKLVSVSGTTIVGGMGGQLASGIVSACTLCPILGFHVGATGGSAKALQAPQNIAVPVP